MRLNRTLIAPALVIAAALSGCASTGTAQPSGSTGAQSAPAAAVTSSAPCTTNACVASDAEQSLPGLTDEEHSVVTKATCKASTVKSAASGIWTVTCTATYSDGTRAKGIASILAAQDKIEWEPTDVLSDGSGG